MRLHAPFNWLGTNQPEIAPTLTPTCSEVISWLAGKRCLREIVGLAGVLWRDCESGVIGFGSRGTSTLSSARPVGSDSESLYP